MKTKIISQEHNPFLKREEFTISIQSDVTPQKSAIVEDLGKDAALTVVNKVHTHFGRKTFVADVVVYESLDAKKKNHVIPKKIRKKMEEEEKARIAAEAKAKADAEAAAKKAEEEAKLKAEEEAKAAEESKEKTQDVSEEKAQETKE